jgi:hypothetical protein
VGGRPYFMLLQKTVAFAKLGMSIVGLTNVVTAKNSQPAMEQ